MIHPTVVYLDTNTLHYIQLCLNIVAQKKLRLPIDDGEFTASVEELSDKEYRKACRRGFYTLKHFQENQWSGRYSPFSEVELQVGRIKGRAFESIARESVPDRIWSRRPEEREISRRVTTEQLAEIEKTIDDFTSALENFEIVIRKDYETEIRDVFDLAKKIVSLVYMDSTDCIIYASALLARADYFITRDSYLRKTINDIRDNVHVRDKLQATLRYDDELPRSFTILSDGKIDPEISIPSDRSPRD